MALSERHAKENAEGALLSAFDSINRLKHMIESIELIGTWQFTRDGEQAFIHFTHTQAFDYMEDNAGHQIMRVWYSIEEPDTIRFRNRPADEGWTCGVNFDGTSLVISAGETETICKRADAHMIPAWFVDELSKLQIR